MAQSSTTTFNELFYRTLSPMNLVHDQRRPASISSLPTEILIVIFGRVERYRRSFNGPEMMIVDASHLEPSEKLFPYSIASVCTLWKEIVITIPKFWIRLVVALDRSSKSFKEFGNHLRWSHNLPFEVRLTSQHNKSACADEKSCLAIAIDTLLPHLHRCTGLFIDVQRSCSFPPPSKIVDFISVCKMVKKLRLECSSHDTCLEPCPITSNPVSLPVVRTLPSVDYISLSGDSIFLYGNYFDPSALSSLKLTNYDARTCLREGGGLTTSSLINMLRMTQPDSITLTNLYFILGDVEVEPLHGNSPGGVYCENLQEDVITAVCILYDAPIQMSITSSSIGGVDRFPGLYLLLTDITEDHGSFVSDPLGRWDGRVLVVSRCPFFDDTMLGLMTHWLDDELYACPQVMELFIDGCPNVSVQVLKRLVEFRWENARKEFEWKNIEEAKFHFFHQGVSPIVRLVVDKPLGALISEEDLEWFNSRLQFEISSANEDSDLV